MTSVQLIIISTDFVQLIVCGEDFLFKLFLLLCNQVFCLFAAVQMHLFSPPGTTISEILKQGFIYVWKGKWSKFGHRLDFEKSKI